MNTATGTIHPLPERVARLRGAATMREEGKGVRHWRLASERMRVSRYVFAAGTEFEPHRHPQEQAFFVIQGRIALRVEGREHVLDPGDALIVPPNVSHGSRVLSASPVEALVIDRM